MENSVNSTYFHIAVGIITNAEGKVLIAKRPKHVEQGGGLWEFPGGKLEEGEDVYTALCRELKEELNLEVLTATPFLKIKHDYRYTPRLAAGTDMRWGFQRGAKSSPLVAVRASLARAGEIQLGNKYPAACRGDIYYPTCSVLLDVWCVKEFQGELFGVEGQEIRWVNFQALQKFSMLAGSLAIIDAIPEAI